MSNASNAAFLKQLYYKPNLHRAFLDKGLQNSLSVRWIQVHSAEHMLHVCIAMAPLIHKLWLKS